MKALWALGQATVREIRVKLIPSYPLAYTTVMTVMDRLARKGIVVRGKKGRAHLYRPGVEKQAVSEHVLAQFIENFFNGSREELRKHLENPGIPISGNQSERAALVEPPSTARTTSDSDAKAEAGIDTSLL